MVRETFYNLQPCFTDMRGPNQSMLTCYRDVAHPRHTTRAGTVGWSQQELIVVEKIRALKVRLEAMSATYLGED